MTRILLLLTCLCSLSALAKQPNIIVILADDMGYADAGFTGAKDIKTPNLDTLAQSGVVFERGYVTHPFCGPSRAGILAGRYQQRFGFGANPAYDPANTLMGLDPTEKLFPKRLQEAGYITGAVGKWHIGAADGFHPNQRGFDYFYGFLGGGHDYFDIDISQPVKEGYLQGLVRNKSVADFEGYLTTAFSRDGVQFIVDNKDKPFFLYMAYSAPHQPLQAPAEDIARYAHIADKRRRIYAAMVDVMDRGIGEIIDALIANGIYENTLIFFLSDNGGPLASDSNPGKSNGSSNAPFRGGKANFYDGGVHVPFVASWPARIPAGTRYQYPVIALDIASTAVAQAGGSLGSPALEGVDLIPFVTGEKLDAPHNALFWRSGESARSHWSILISDSTKYLKDKDSKKPQMFYLPDDVSESNDILSENGALAKAMYAQWQQWDKGNVPDRFMGYKPYHRARDRFFEKAIPGEAKKSGYQPKVEASW